jgi:hypothetical protein
VLAQASTSVDGTKQIRSWANQEINSTLFTNREVITPDWQTHFIKTASQILQKTPQFGAQYLTRSPILQIQLRIALQNFIFILILGFA